MVSYEAVSQPEGFPETGFEEISALTILNSIMLPPSAKPGFWPGTNLGFSHPTRTSAYGASEFAIAPRS